MKIGLIGLGRIGQVHLKSLSTIEDVDIVCINEVYIDIIYNFYLKIV